MILTDQNLTAENIAAAFNTPGGFKMQDAPAVRAAVANHAKGIVYEIHARAAASYGMDFDTYITHKRNGTLPR